MRYCGARRPSSSRTSWAVLDLDAVSHWIEHCPAFAGVTEPSRTREAALLTYSEKPSNCGITIQYNTRQCYSRERGRLTSESTHFSYNFYLADSSCHRRRGPSLPILTCGPVYAAPPPAAASLCTGGRRRSDVSGRPMLRIPARVCVRVRMDIHTH